jgi:tetratricopeptide (TPR) repeat protein
MWDFVQAEDVYKKWLGFVSQNDHLLARKQLAYLYRTLGRFEEAKGQIRLGLDLAGQLKADQALVYLYYDLAYHYLRSGKYQEALDAVDKPRLSEQVSIPDRIIFLEMRGWIFAEMGRTAEARQAANEIKTLVETSLYKKGIRLYDLLTGIIRLKEKDYPGAIASLKKAISLLPHPFSWDTTDDGLYMYQLAAAYYESGDLEKAREELERMEAFIPGRTLWGDLYALGYYRLGLIYEKQGVKAKAKENYERFLDLWKAADPGLPEVEDAKKRLAGLS